MYNFSILILLIIHSDAHLSVSACPQTNFQQVELQFGGRLRSKPDLPMFYERISEQSSLLILPE